MPESTRWSLNVQAGQFSTCRGFPNSPSTIYEDATPWTTDQVSPVGVILCPSARGVALEVSVLVLEALVFWIDSEHSWK